jgi:antitoxin ParD1/3/4
MAKNTSILLGSHYDNFIGGASGRYNSASEVILTALRLLETEEQKMKLLRNEFEIGENRKMVSSFDRKKHLQDLRKKHL